MESNPIFDSHCPLAHKLSFVYLKAVLLASSRIEVGVVVAVGR